MPETTTNGHARTPRGGVSGVALELLSASARGAVMAPVTLSLSLVRLPLIGFQQACLVTDAVCRTSLEIAGRGLHLLGLRSGPEEVSIDPTGYLTEPESRNGEYAEFSPEFTGRLDTGVAVGADPDMLSDADADLIAELGTDFSADLAMADRSGGDLSAEDLEAAAADLAAEAGATVGPWAPAGPSAEALAAEGPAGAESAAGGPAAEKSVDVQPVDIVTRAAVAAEEAAADDSLPQVERAELPIEDFDHVTAGSLRGRLRRLELPELRTLRTYEQEHAHRLPILTLLENRIAKLEAAPA
jgi:hypothetical protein